MFPGKDHAYNEFVVQLLCCTHISDLDNKFIVCMVLPREHRDKDAYKMRFEHGLVQGLVRTDQLVHWWSP